MASKKIIVQLLFLCLLSSGAYSQFFDNIVYNRKSVYAEVFGTGLGASVNYEYLFKDYGMKQGVRGGPGFFINFLEENSPTIISANAEYISFAGARNHHLEWGVGAAFQYKYFKRTDQSVSYYIVNSDTTAFYTDHNYMYKRTGPVIVPRIGYRYESPDGGLVVRVAYTPLLYILNREKETYDGQTISSKTLPFSTKFTWGGVSIGFSFY